MDDLLTREGLAWIVGHLLEQAQRAVEEYDQDNETYYYGRMLAYYEMLDAIKSRIHIREGNPDEFGLGFNVDHLESEMKRRIGVKGEKSEQHEK